MSYRFGWTSFILNSAFGKNPLSPRCKKALLRLRAKFFLLTSWTDSTQGCSASTAEQPSGLCHCSWHCTTCSVCWLCHGTAVLLLCTVSLRRVLNYWFLSINVWFLWFIFHSGTIVFMFWYAAHFIATFLVRQHNWSLLAVTCFSGFFGRITLWEGDRCFGQKGVF